MWCINDRNIYNKNKHLKRCFTSLGSKVSSEVTKGKFTKSTKKKQQQRKNIPTNKKPTKYSHLLYIITEHNKNNLI